MSVLPVWIATAVIVASAFGLACVVGPGAGSGAGASGAQTDDGAATRQLSAEAQGPGPEVDPAEYFPSPEELPAGFALLPGLGIVEQGPDVSTVSRLYVRENPQLGPDEETLVDIEIAAAASLAAARASYQEGIEQLTLDVASPAPLGVALGDEATVGHRPLPATGTRGTEEAVILFRAGRFRVTVTWVDYADLPNVDDAVQVARLVERRIKAAPR